MGIDFPQYHPHYEETEGTVLLPRTSSILRLHRESLHQLLTFGSCPEQFRRMVRHRAREGNHVHAAIHDYLYRGIRSGTIRHRGFDVEDMDEPVDIPVLTESEALKFDRFRTWLKTSGAVILRPPEERIVSNDLGYGGTLDMAARIDKKNMVVDIKIGDKVHLPNLLQGEAYAQLLQTEDVDVDAIGILHLGLTNRVGYNFTVDRTRKERRRTFMDLLEKWRRLFPEPFGQESDDDMMTSDPDISIPLQPRF